MKASNDYDVKDDNAFDEEKVLQDYQFDSLSDFADIDGGGLKNGVGCINVEEYAFQEADLDTKYRSVQAVNPTVYSAYSSPSLNSMDPPRLSKGFATNNQYWTKAPPSIVVKSRDSVSVPDQPFYVAPTSFDIIQSIDDIVCAIDRKLSDVLEISFNFLHKKCRWECVYLCGSTRSKFEFSVYKNGEEGSYIVEGNRVCGESFPFTTMYRSIREKLLNDESSSPTSVTNFQSVPLPESFCELSSSEIADAMCPIIDMACNGTSDSQVVAAQVLCDLSLQQNMLETLCGEKCVTSLMNLMHVDFGFCSQHAICALANISSSRSCHDILLRDERFLRCALDLCSNGGYESAEMRRESARMLANICSSSHSSAAKLLQRVGERDVSVWLNSVDGLKDDRLLLHAKRAKKALKPCLA